MAAFKDAFLRIAARIFYQRFFPFQPQLVGIEDSLLKPLPRINALESWKDGILWNMPKSRRSLERRRTRRFGALQWGQSKVIPVNRKIRVDNKTGEFFELGKLAPESYRRIMAETKAIQAKMKETFGRNPVEKEFEVVYENESAAGTKDKKVIVEIPKPRPPFFSRNLLQKTTTANKDTTTTTVRPSGLG